MLKENLSSTEKFNQLHILAQYNIYKEAADDINNLQQAINVDTKQSGKSLAENFLRKLRLEEVKESPKFINIDRLLNDTVIKEQQLSSDEVEGLYSSLFKFSMHSTTQGKALRKLFYKKFSPVLTSGDLLQGLEKLDRFLTTFQLLENGGVANYYKKLLVDGDAVLDLIKKKKQYKDNILLQQLVPMLPEEARATYNTKLFNKRYTLYEQENLIAGFRELMFKEPEFAKKLIMQQLLQSGASLSQNSYQNILPEEYLNLSKKALQTTTFTPDDVMRKFILTHWKSNELFKTKYIGGSKGPDYLTVKVRLGTEFVRVKNRDKEMFFYQSTGEIAEGKTVFTRIEPLGNYPWAINVKGVKEQPKTIIQAPVNTTKISAKGKIISEPYGVVVAETNPTKAQTEEFVDLIQPQIQAQAYKENIGKDANDMFMYGLRWTRKSKAKKPLNNKSYANKGLPITNAKATDGYVYDTVDQNGKPLAPLSDLRPIINEIESTLNIDMSNYDAVIGNIYLPGQNISTHRDTTESLSAKNYPVVVYTIGNNSGITIYENVKNPGAPSFASDKPTLIPTKNGSIYTFGMNGNGRFEVAHDTPKNIKRDQKFPPITMPDGRIITNYTITLTFRRAADLTTETPTSPNILNQPAAKATKSTVRKTTKTTFVEEEGYSTAETLDLGKPANSLKKTWDNFTMAEIKHLKSKNINNFGDFSTEVGMYESTGLSEEEAVETILSCK
jgi:alkylated DNA repair dioxygenase AlkB